MGTIFGSLLLTSDNHSTENDSKPNDDDYVTNMEIIIAFESTTIKHSVYYQHLEHLIHSCDAVNNSHCKIVFTSSKSNSDKLYVLTHLLFPEHIVCKKTPGHVHKILDYKNNTIRPGKPDIDSKIITRNGISYYSHPKYDKQYLQLLNTDKLSLFSFEFVMLLQQTCTKVLHDYNINISTSIKANKLPFWDQIAQKIMNDVCNTLIKQKRGKMIPYIFKSWFDASQSEGYDNYAIKYYATVRRNCKRNFVRENFVREMRRHYYKASYGQICKTFEKLEKQFSDNESDESKDIHKKIFPNEGKNKPGLSIYKLNKTTDKYMEYAKGVMNSCINQFNFETFSDNDVMLLLDYTNDKQGEINLRELCDKILPKRPIQLLAMYKKALISNGWTKKDINTFYECIAKGEKLDDFKKYDTVHPYSQKSRVCNWWKTNNCKFSKPWSKPCDNAHDLSELKVVYGYIIKAIRCAMDVDFECKYKSKYWSDKNEAEDMKLCDSYKDKITHIAEYVREDTLRVVNGIFKKYFREYLGYPFPRKPDMYYYPDKRPIIYENKISFIDNKGCILGVSTNSYSNLSNKKYNKYCGGNGIWRYRWFVAPPPGICLNGLIDGMVMTETQFKKALEENIDINDNSINTPSNNLNIDNNYNSLPIAAVHYNNQDNDSKTDANTPHESNNYSNPNTSVGNQLSSAMSTPINDSQYYSSSDGYENKYAMQYYCGNISSSSDENGKYNEIYAKFKKSIECNSKRKKKKKSTKNHKKNK